ncbi:hypothetical protein PsorP6_005644 [Peronosclerospora sorghi]|uniref:Uncharacterized protein n=1 Tax=Peronosclerospora sorghi TaxID=230839 RepID=A0ACC0W4M2_9STRA|nr:hypothetical protein PsorP6_005644 [Peronosclerospora sorghi]
MTASYVQLSPEVLIRTFLQVAEWYYWKTLQNEIKEFVKTSENFTHSKHDNQRKNRLLMPIPIPDQCWNIVSMVFISEIPVSNGFDDILTVVYKLSKRTMYATVHANDDAPETVKTFFEAVVRHHGLPEVIISDRDSNVVKCAIKLVPS